jgi:hypothetical protein
VWRTPNGYLPVGLRVQMPNFLCLRGAVLCCVLVVSSLVVPSAAIARGCRSDIHGDHITAANDFQAFGISCSDAVIAATEYTDSAAGVETTDPGIERYMSAPYEWTCRTTELPNPHGGLGTYFHCSAKGLTAHIGPARMAFKWWLSNERNCPNEDIEAPFSGSEGKVLAGLMTVSRLRPCSSAWPWIEEAMSVLHDTGAEVFQTTLSPAGQKEYDYHYYDNADNKPGAGATYICVRVPFTSEDGRAAERWDCREPNSPAGSVEYSWTIVA